MNVIWTTDHTTNPVTQLPATSGPVGGQCTIHLSFQEPTGFEGATVTGLVVHEKANHYPDQDLSHTVVASQAFPPCDGGNTGGWMYEDAYWASTGDHNSDHTITATMTYSWMTYVNGMPQGGSATATKTITVTPGNLLITSTMPANPAPIQWDPSTMTTAVASAAVSCSYKMSQPATLQIYTSDQTPVKKLTQNVVIGPGSTTVSFMWDGTSDDTSLYPPGYSKMGKGVYLFQWTVGTQGDGQDLTTDKSSYLTIGSGTAGTTYDDGKTLTAGVGYSLSDPTQRSASQGQIDFFVLETSLGTQFTQPLAASYLAPANYTYPFSVASPADSGFQIFLVSALDNHADGDRGHQSMWALQRNNQHWGDAAIGFNQHDFTSFGPAWFNGMTPLGYKPLPKESQVASYETDPALEDLRTALTYTIVQNRTAQKPLGSVLFAGHGDQSGGMLVMAGPAFGDGTTQRFLCTQSWYLNHNLANTTNSIVVDGIAPSGSGSLSDLFLVVLIGCGQLQNGGESESALAGDFLSHGAACAVDVGMDEQKAPYAGDWLTGYSTDAPDVANSFLSLLQRGASVGYAAMQSAQYVNRRYAASLNGLDPGGVGAQEQIVGAHASGNSGEYFKIKH